MEGNVVRVRLQEFVEAHIPEADISCVDDIVLGYVVDVLTGLRQEEEESFDVDQFVEIMAAYIPEFKTVDSTSVCEWIFELASGTPTADVSSVHHFLAHQPSTYEQTATCKLGSDGDGNGDRKSLSHSTAKQLEHNELYISSNTATDQENTTEEEEKEEEEKEKDCDNSPVLLLLEMFPDLGAKVVRQQVKRLHGDMDRCIQVLLELSEKMSQKHPHKVEIRETIPLTAQDKSMKEEVLARYEFVDTDEDKLHHRPILPKQEPKKMVRYRDGKVVSTKGERYTMETKQDKENDTMKKTYVNLKPLRKYRFH